MACWFVFVQRTRPTCKHIYLKLAVHQSYLTSGPMEYWTSGQNLFTHKSSMVSINKNTIQHDTLADYRIVGFFEVLKFHKWPIFSFFAILFSRTGLPKAQLGTQWVVHFFEGLNFMNDQHPRNLRNLHTSKKPTIRYRLLCTAN